MFTIKVCRNDVKNGLTFLHEGKNVRYKFVTFGDQKDLNEQIKIVTENHQLPWQYDMEVDFENDDSYNKAFLAIYYIREEDEALEVCLTRAAKVFIMQAGQTVDTIYC
jgi:hypothetical protein